MKIGDKVTSRVLKGTARILAIRPKEVLVECDSRDDGKMVICVSEGIIATDKKRRLRWLKRSDIKENAYEL